MRETERERQTLGRPYDATSPLSLLLECVGRGELDKLIILPCHPPSLFVYLEGKLEHVSIKTSKYIVPNSSG